MEKSAAISRPVAVTSKVAMNASITISVIERTGVLWYTRIRLANPIPSPIVRIIMKFDRIVTAMTLVAANQTSESGRKICLSRNVVPIAREKTRWEYERNIGVFEKPFRDVGNPFFGYFPPCSH